MPHNISEILERVYLGSTSSPEELTPAKLEERQTLWIQILSLGFDLDEDPAMEKWSNVELKELLDALVAAKEGTLEVEEETGEEEEEREAAPSARIQKHVRGVNDMMSGALPPRRESESAESAPGEIDDPTVSIDSLPHLYRSMPHYMISVKVLRKLNLFADPLYYDALPSDFFTRACDKIDIIADPCPERPPLLRTCRNYQRIDLGMTTRKTPRPGHDHSKDGDQKKKGSSGGGGSLGGATEGGGAIAV